LRCYDDQINEKEDKKGSAVILLLILFEQKEVENKDVKLKESESTISGLQFSNSQMESKIAHMQEQMEFWDEESSKMKERLQASSVRIDEQEKELRRSAAAFCCCR